MGMPNSSQLLLRPVLPASGFDDLLLHNNVVLDIFDRFCLQPSFLTRTLLRTCSFGRPGGAADQAFRDW